MFWLIYIFFSLIFSYLIGLFFKGKIKKLIIFSTLVILFTPAQIEISTNNYAPALFTFLFNSLLEQNYSLRGVKANISKLSNKLIVSRVSFLF